MIRYCIIVIGLIYLAGCASSSKMKDETQTGEKQPTGKYDESFDPLTLDDGDIVITKDESKSQIQQSGTMENDNTDATKKVVMHEVEGYRVQILATQGIESATLQQQKAVDRFADHEYKVYLIYEAPLYRLRLGDALTRQEAEKIRDLAKERGYDEAFIVRSKVIAPETSDPDNGL